MTKSTYQPPYTITPEILNRVAAICEAVGSWLRPVKCWR